MVFSDTSMFHDHLINLSLFYLHQGFCPQFKTSELWEQIVWILINVRNVIHSVTLICPSLIYLFICGCIQNFTFMYCEEHI
jgi:hypothetical protein